METIIQWFKEYDYIMLLAGAVLLVWLYWLPRIIAPLLQPHYNNLSPNIKALINLILPTIEKVMLDSWGTFYTEVIREVVDITDTELDDKVWAEIDKRITNALDNKDVGYYPKDETPPKDGFHG